jgi:FixJ family two-component response regulator
VTDLSIPGMRGNELAARARSGRPALGVFFASGYEPNDETKSIAGSVFLRKPYDEQALKKALESALRSR